MGDVIQGSVPICGERRHELIIIANHNPLGRRRMLACLKRKRARIVELLEPDENSIDDLFLIECRLVANGVDLGLPVLEGIEVSPAPRSHLS